MLIDNIIALLQSKGGYRLVQQPLRVVNVEFKNDFDAVLEGPDNQRGLVLVSATGGHSLRTIQNRLGGLSIALSRTGSMRPVTVVLVIDKTMEDAELAAMEAIYRVVVVPPGANLDERLQTLLPLRLPLAKATKSVDSALRQQLGADVSDPLIAALIDAAQKGSSDVERVMRQHIEQLARLKATRSETP